MHASSFQLWSPTPMVLTASHLQVAQLNETLKEAKSAEKEVRAEVAGVLREGRAAQQELAAAEAAAEKAVSVFAAFLVVRLYGWCSAGVLKEGRAAQQELAAAEAAAERAVGH